MLVARRDPPFDVDGYNVAPGDPGAYRAPKAPRLTQFITVVQMVGSLLAVPVGIASAYSFYRANFSPETTCQSLRSGIVAMLDKSVDATTRRILVRRDVEAFEKTCASVDPDATAAFKTLLAVEKTVTPAVVEPVVPKVQHSEAAPKEPVRKVEPRQQAVAKQPAVSAAPVMAEPANRDSAVSDTQWLDAVRQALVTHKSEPPAIEAGQVTTTIGAGCAPRCARECFGSACGYLGRSCRYKCVGAGVCTNQSGAPSTRGRSGAATRDCDCSASRAARGHRSSGATPSHSGFNTAE